MRLTGPVRSLGLGPLVPECSTAALLALAAPQDRALMEDFLQSREPGEEALLRARMRGGPACVWRGVWLEEGGRAAGAIVAETQFAPEPRDALTGLLERRGFLALAAERLQVPLSYVLVVADLDRLRRLNEALGHERADLVLSALGSRLMAAFPRDALLARVGEDEFAILAPDIGRSPVDLARQVLEQPLRVAGFDIYPTLTIGQVRAEGGEDAPDVAELLRRAELNLEAAKLQRRAPAATAIKERDGDGLSLDDFGTGFSSLSYLTRLPFDTLKIDRYFVRTMDTNEGSDKIVRSIVNLGRDLELEVVAEGVENAGMARRLLQIGCDYGQGFGYAPALSPQEAEVYLNESYADGAAPVKLRG